MSRDRLTGALLLHTILTAAVLACASDTTLAATAASDSTPRSAEVRTIAAWNQIALRTTASGPFSPPRETRTMALLSAAVFDAVNSITQQYEAYAVRLRADRTASIESAVASASHHILVSLYPGATAALKVTYDSALTHVPAGPAKDAGIALGRGVAAALLVMRSTDRADAAVSHTPESRIGVWTPTPPAFAPALEAGWGRVTPFVLDSGSQFRPPPPPALASQLYTRDYDEMVRAGAATSTQRTAAQSEAARFWITTAAQLWNQLVRHVTVARGVDAAAAARAYLLLNVAGADAMIAAWDAKFAYNQWRPVTAIRYRGPDANLTSGMDTTWAPLIITPPFPDYPAGHTAYGGAAERVLSAVFGERPGDLAITSPTAGGATHHYQSFAEIAEEVVNARVWGGVHWRSSSTVGRDLGRRVGDLALTRAPRATR